MFPVDDLSHPFHYLRVVFCYVMVFMYVFRKIVKPGLSFDCHQLPVSGPYSYLVSLVEFPVKELVPLLVLLVTQKGRGE